MKTTTPGLFVTLLLLAACTIPSCRTSLEDSYAEIAEQRGVWEAEMNEAFPRNTRDTVELRQRLEHFRQTGNLVGQRTMLRVLGFEARNNSLFSRAIEHHTEALALAYQVVDTAAITNLLNELGTDFRRTGAYEQAMKYHYSALETAENYDGRDTAVITRNMASAYNGIGVIYSAMNEQAEAIKSYENALKIEIGKQNFLGMAMNYANIGSVYLEEGDYTKAMEYFTLSLENNTKIESALGIGLCEMHIGNVYDRQGDHRRALDQYLKAYDILADSDTWHWIKACFSIGEACMTLGDHRRAKSYLDDGLRAAIEIQAPAYIEQAYALLSDYHYAQGDYRRAAEESYQSAAWADTVHNNLEASRLMEPRIQYETGRFTRQIQQMDEAARVQKARQRMAIVMALPFVLGLIFLSIFLYGRRKQSQRTAAELKELGRMRTNFFTNITHELRTPLSTIIGYARMLLEKYGDSPGSDPGDVERLAIIHRGGETLLTLVNEMLEFARSEAGMSRLVWRQGDVVSFIRSVAEPFEQMAQAKSINLFTLSYTKTLEMNYAPEALKKVMGNLLSNAIRHTPPGKHIEIYIHPDPSGSRCVITVRDEGEGIAPDALPRVFELYYTSGAGGTGIGLALSKQLVEEMDGEISVESTPGYGTKFHVSLPVSTEPIPAAESSNADTGVPVIARAQPEAIQTHGVSVIATASGVKREAIYTHGETGLLHPDGARNDDKPVVLVVEDDPDMASYVRTVLGGGYTVLHAANGVEGLAMAEQYVPDLILTDVMMPEKDGYELTADLRASVATSHIPVVMLTAKTTSDDKVAGLQVGADAYLPKPFNERELTAHIEQLLTSRAKLREIYADALQAGGFDDIEAVDIDDRDRDFIARLLVAVNSHLDDEAWFPDGLAEEMCLSRSQLYRKVKTMTGKTLLAFIMDVRMKRAGAMLSNGNRNITEVALACGFSDMSYFTRSFKTAFGCTPSQYVKNTEP